MNKQFLEEHYKIIMIILLLLVVYCVYRIRQLYPPAINVDSNLIKSILKEGIYEYKGNYTPTDIYKNGLLLKGEVHITYEKNNAIVAELHKEAYDAKTKNKVYEALRKVTFYYKPDHGNNLFRESVTYKDDKVSSRLYGYATASTNNSISFSSSGSWLMSTHDYKHIDSIIEKTKSGFVHRFMHYNILGFVDFEMKDNFTR